MHIDNTEFVRRKTDYNNLCREIHLAYAELERINKANSKGKVYMRSFPACKEINLWTYWQGYNAMAPKILVIGQDFGCPFGGAFGEEADLSNDTFARYRFEPMPQVDSVPTVALISAMTFAANALGGRPYIFRYGVTWRKDSSME